MVAFALFGAVMHAALMAVAAFFVFFAAARSEHALRVFGMVLGTVLTLLSAGALACGIAGPVLHPDGGPLPHAGNMFFMARPMHVFTCIVPPPDTARTKSGAPVPLPLPCPPPPGK